MTDAGLRLSIVIPSKDRPRLLRAAVGSALAALPEGTEVLVVDDRSTPPAADSLPADPRLRVTVSGAAPGASGARNWGVAQARGARILFLDDDDLLLPGYAEWVLDQKADYGFSAIATFRGLDTPAVPAFAPAQATPVAEVRPFRRQVAGLGCGFWIDRGVFLKLGGIAEDIRVNEDTEFSIRALAAGLRGSYSPEPGVLVRRHGFGHLTHSATALDRAGNFATILARHAAWLDRHAEARMHLRLRQVKLLAHAGDAASAGRTIREEAGLRDRLHLWSHFLLTRLADRIRRR